MTSEFFPKNPIVLVYCNIFILMLTSVYQWLKYKTIYFWHHKTFEKVFFGHQRPKLVRMQKKIHKRNYCNWKNHIGALPMTGKETFPAVPGMNSCARA